MTRLGLTLKSSIFVLVQAFAFLAVSGQPTGYTPKFLDYQRSIPKINDLLRRKEDTLAKQFQAKGLIWPARFIYIRSFKYDSELEIWVKNKASEKYKLFKTYKICALAGSMGPKRMAGDYQVPEGFYYINEFNPRSLYHLSLGLNYPNASDKMLSDISQPGGEIFIHGSCVTTGCIPITDEQIEEVYVLAAHAKDLGQDFIPVHIFPVNFKNPRSVTYLNRYLINFSELTAFEKNMKNAFNYFEKYREVPVVMVNSKGDYVTEEVQMTPPPEENVVVTRPEKKIVHMVQPIREEDLAKTVDKLPEFPGGIEGYKTFVNELGHDMVKELANGQKKAYVMVEYIVDTAGRTVYANALSGGNPTMNEKIVNAFMQIKSWAPATRAGQRVPIKLKQTIMVGEP